MNNSRETYTYDSKGNELTYLNESWVNGQWANSARLTNTYNPNGYTLTKLYETWVNEQWTKTNTGLNFIDSKKHNFSFYGYKIEVTYQGTTPVKEETNNNSFALNCSPNPASGLININYILTEPQPVSFIITNS